MLILLGICCCCARRKKAADLDDFKFEVVRANTFSNDAFEGGGGKMSVVTDDATIAPIDEGRARAGSASASAARSPSGSGAGLGLRRRAGGGPPPPHVWFHGSISRDVAEERLASHPKPRGSFLVRARDAAEGSYALTMGKPGAKPIHYTLQLPNDTKSPLLLQGKPVPAAHGSSLKDVIAHFHSNRGLPILLQHPVPIPSNAEKLLRVAHMQSSKSSGAGAVASPAPFEIVHDLLKRDFDRYAHDVI